jgi:HJR/Mrr/RecB family endonuclease
MGVVVVEVKKLSRQSRVSVEAVRQLLSAVTTIGAHTGILVTTAGFTPAAVALATGTPVLLRTIEQLVKARSGKELFHSIDIDQSHQPG